MFRLTLALVLIAHLFALPVVHAADGEEEEIIIVEDDSADEIIILEEDGDASDELIVIEEEEQSSDATEDAVSDSTVGGALGRLWEAWHIGADSELGVQLQAVPTEDGIWRTGGGVRLETWLLPAPNLSLYADGFARFFIDSTPDSTRLVTFSDLYETYAQVNLGIGSMQLGRLVIPWAKTSAAALGDRLNPPDHRRNRSFPEPIRGKQPQLGALLRTSLGALGLELVGLTSYEPTEGSLAAANQGGVRIARYQGALLRSPARLGGFADFYRREALLPETVDLWDETSVALRARRRLGDWDLGGTVVWGIDETPSLNLTSGAARFLASQATSGIDGGSNGNLDGACTAEGGTDLACLGGAGALSHARAVSFSADAAWGLGIVILKAEAIAFPILEGLPGKTSILIDADNGMISRKLSHYGATLALEGGIGEWLAGSIELFDLVWEDVPAGTILWGVETFDANRDETRTVHRVALAWQLGGDFLSERLSWSLRGEAGISQSDLLSGLEVRYRLPVMGLYVGSEGTLFTGPPGSPGWLRQDASMLRVFLGEGN